MKVARAPWSLGPSVLLCALASALSLAPAQRASAAAPADADFFDKHVKPLLDARCAKCHGGEGKPKGGLDLMSRQGLLKGGDLGPAIDLDKPASSLILRAVEYADDDLQMPPRGKLPAGDIEVLRRWVAAGAPYSASATASTAAGPAHHGPPAADSPEARNHWAFKPVRRPPVPAVRDKAWVRNPVDAFILAGLEARGFAPAPPASKAALLRRAYYDLIGLPPSPAEVEAFLADNSPDAYEKLVDRLLASPHYGEKWGRHYLDLVRFAETNSYERDNPKPHAWRFRDYVIRSLNADKPFDAFVREQLAGDEMPDAGSDPDKLIATGFYRLGIWDDEPTDREQARYDMLDDVVATVGQVFLGVTLDCARCHDHKIDPVPQKDYYRFLAFFQGINHYRNGGPTDERPIFATPGDKAAFEAAARDREARRKQAAQLVREWENDFRQLLSGEPGRGEVKREDVPRLIRTEGRRVLGDARYEQYKRIKKDLEELSKPAGQQDMALVVTESGPRPPDTHVLIRGNASAKGAKVNPGFPAILGTPDPAIPAPSAGAKTSGRRTVLANWITSPDNPLTARVLANRLWQYHFGRGLVRSSNDFGLQGDRPTHPELLDYLASEVVARGWRLKSMHRLIMTSSAYRMSAAADPVALAADPRNDAFWRFDIRRLTAEEIRDSILAVNGTLNLKLYGPSVYPPIPKEVLAGQSVPGKGWHTSGPEDAARRSVYVHVKRSLRVPILEAFDAAETDKSCPVRFATVQPTQALSMINGDFMNGEARKLADRLKREAGSDRRAQVTLALRLVTARAPTAAEVDRGVNLIESLVAKDGATPEVALRSFCLVALNLNEFLYVD